jgi:LuxR family maltose regulon positive regulatory protein
VREVLRFELELREPSELVRLHLRASAWFIAHGDSDAATDHAVAAGDPARAGTLLWAEGARCSSPADDRATRWLAAFTEEQLASSPQLALTEGYRCLAGGDARQAEHWARRVAAAVHGAGARTRSPALLASVAMLRSAGATGGIEQMHSEATRAYELLDESSHLRPLACLLRGVALELLGERDEARQALEAAVRLGGGPVAQVESLCLTQLALLDVAEGDWEQAGDHVLRASGSLAEHRLARHPTSAMTYAASALVHSQRGVADEAKRDLVSASRLLDDLGAYMPWHEVQTRIVMARACARLADVVRARALLSEASRWARRIERVEALVGALDAGWGEVDDLSASALSGPGSLTMAELRVLRFLPSHLSFREIGDRLHVSGNTVKTQAHAIYAKLGAGSRTEAVAQAAALGLIDVTIL